MVEAVGQEVVAVDGPVAAAVLVVSVGEVVAGAAPVVDGNYRSFPDQCPFKFFIFPR